MKNKSLFLFILFLSFLATTLVIWKLFFARKSAPTPQPTPSPTPTITTKGRGEPGLYEKLQKETQEKYPLLHFVPYQTLNWSVDYLGPLSLEVILKKDTPVVREEVLSWIKSQGVDPSTHQISWKVAL